MDMATCPVFNSSGYIGGSPRFDGVDDRLDTGSDWVGTGEDTVSVWIYPVTFGGAGIASGIKFFALSTPNGCGCISLATVGALGTSPVNLFFTTL